MIMSHNRIYICCIYENELRGIYMFAFYLNLIEDYDDKKIFEHLFYTYRKQMLYLAMSFVHNSADAEDIVHDVFLKIAQKHMSVIKNIKNDDDVRNYLLKATKNTALNKIKAKKKEVLPLDCISEISDDSVDNDIFVDAICKKCEYKQIVSAIKSLNEVYRYPLYYHFVLELPIKQVAKILNQSSAATKKQLVRGKKKLLDLIETKGE